MNVDLKVEVGKNWSDADRQKYFQSVVETVLYMRVKPKSEEPTVTGSGPGGKYSYVTTEGIHDDVASKCCPNVSVFGEGLKSNKLIISVKLSTSVKLLKFWKGEQWNLSVYVNMEKDLDMAEAFRTVVTNIVKKITPGMLIPWDEYEFPCS